MVEIKISLQWWLLIGEMVAKKNGLAELVVELLRQMVVGKMLRQIVVGKKNEVVKESG